MVHPDGDVARVEEHVAGQNEQLQLLFRGRQVVDDDALLVRLHPGNVGVGVEGHAFRTEGQHRVHVVPEPLRRLERKPVDQVEIHGGEADFSAKIEEPPRLLFGLIPVDRVLDLRGEVLHAHRDPVESELAQQADLVGAGDARVDLDGDLGVGFQAEVSQKALLECGHFVDRLVGRRTASPVVLADPSTVWEVFRKKVDLRVKIVEVLVGNGVVLCDHDVASAERTPFVAEGEMDIEGQGLGGRVVGLRELSPVGARVEPLVELHGGGIGRVPGARSVILLQQIDRHLRARIAHSNSPCLDNLADDSHSGLRPVYSEKIPASTNRATSAKPTPRRAASTSSGGTHASMVSQ